MTRPCSAARFAAPSVSRTTAREPIPAAARTTAATDRPALPLRRDRVEDHRQRNHHQRRRGDAQLAVLERQFLQLAADIHAGADVFAAVNAVARGPHDFRHVGPHRIESRPAERPAIARAGDGNPPALGLKPGGENDVGREVVVAQLAVLGVLDAGEDALGAILDAVQAALALVDVVQVADLGAQRVGLVAIRARRRNSASRSCGNSNSPRASPRSPACPRGESGGATGCVWIAYLAGTASSSPVRLCRSLPKRRPRRRRCRSGNRATP